MALLGTSFTTTELGATEDEDAERPAVQHRGRTGEYQVLRPRVEETQNHQEDYGGCEEAREEAREKTSEEERRQR